MPKIRMYGGPKDGKDYLVSSGKEEVVVDGQVVPVYMKPEKGRLVKVLNWSKAKPAK